MHYVYIIYSEAFDTFYMDASHNLWLRLNKHNTTKYRLWILKAAF